MLNEDLNPGGLPTEMMPEGKPPKFTVVDDLTVKFEFEDPAAKRAELIANFRKIMQWAAEGKISSHVHATFPLAKTADAMAVLSSRKAMGKVILNP